MTRSAFGPMHCKLARGRDVLGDWWTPLILRDLLIGVQQFDEIQRDLGIATNVLTTRLRLLTAHGVIDRRATGTAVLPEYVRPEIPPTADWRRTR